MLNYPYYNPYQQNYQTPVSSGIVWVDGENEVHGVAAALIEKTVLCDNSLLLLCEH